uniref:Interleukin 22 n=1 Tax=Ctenopharyngodon idella TaxID=7959 RepID=A0A7G9VWD7_CTEID|nr:interleukin 22 [Ctenopharyngodon idella]
MKFLTLLAVMCCWCFLCGQAMHLMRPRPKPLDSPVTWNNLYVMTEHAQKEDKDHETRLLPVFSEVMLKEEGTCCINTMILDYYLKHILHADDHVDKYPQIRFVRSDLHRLAQDLKPYCSNSAEHAQVKKYKDRYSAYERKSLTLEARNKAVGETIILFHYLFESCSARM